MHRLVIDTNLLCLLVVGQVGVSEIARHKRLSKYTVQDFERLGKLLGIFDRLTLCPPVLAECSNLLRQTAEPLRSLAATVLARVVGFADERNVAAKIIVGQPLYQRLGFTDAVLLELGKNGRVLLSDDLDLCLASAQTGHRYINYNHLREGIPLEQLGTF